MNYRDKFTRTKIIPAIKSRNICSICGNALVAVLDKKQFNCRCIYCKQRYKRS